MPMFIAALAAKTWKEHKCPSTDEWIRRCNKYIYINTHIYIHKGTLFSLRKNEIM